VAIETDFPTRLPQSHGLALENHDSISATSLAGVVGSGGHFIYIYQINNSPTNHPWKRNNVHEKEGIKAHHNYQSEKAIATEQG
jgi:hypothetical protein